MKNDGNLFEWFNSNKDRLELSQRRFNILIEWLAYMNGMTIDGYRKYVYACFENKKEGI